MSNDFLYFTTPEVLAKIDIDPRLEDCFKRVMHKIQEYFDANGYTAKRNYKEYLEKYLLNSGKNNLRFYIKELSNPGMGGFYVRKNSEICINKNRLTLYKDLLDSTMCHEFIHFLVMHELEDGKADPDIINGGFINESLTEILTEQMYPNSQAYDAQVSMQKYANLLSGQQNNFQRFLDGHIDARYCSSNWESYRLFTNTFQKDFQKEGYINLHEAQTNKNFVGAQRELINLFLRPNSTKTIEEYIDAIDKLIERPVKDNEYINTKVVAEMDNTMVKSMKLANPELDRFLHQKLAELRDQIFELKNAKGFEFKIGGKCVQIDQNHNLYGNFSGLVSHWNPQTGIMTFTYDGEKVEIDTNNINYHEKEQNAAKCISELSSYFSKTASKDLNMIGLAKSLGDNLTKFEKFDLPMIGEKTQRTIYIATFAEQIAILNNVQKVNNISDLDLNEYIGMSSVNTNIAGIYSNNIGHIQDGVLFSELSDKQLYSKQISLYAGELIKKMTDSDIATIINLYKQSEEFVEDSEEEIKKDAIIYAAKKQFSTLPKEQEQAYFSTIVKNNSQFVVSTKNGEIEVSELYGNKTAYASKKEVLFSNRDNGMYNDVITSISDTQEKTNCKFLPIDSNGNLVIEKKNDADEYDDYYENSVNNSKNAPKRPYIKKSTKEQIMKNNERYEIEDSVKDDQKILFDHDEHIDKNNENFKSPEKSKNILNDFQMNNNIDLYRLLYEQKVMEESNLEEQEEDVEEHGMSM